MKEVKNNVENLDADWDVDVVDDLEETSGSNRKLLLLDEINIDGETGQWSIKHLTQPKIKDENGNMRYPITEIEGDSVNVIIIKKGIKKTIKKGDNGKVLAETGEYINKDKPAYFKQYEENKKNGIIVPSSIVGEGTGFKNIQIMYVIFNGNLCRLCLNGKKVSQVEGVHDNNNDYFNFIWNNKKSYTFITEIKSAKIKNPKNPKKYIYTCMFNKKSLIQKGDPMIPFILESLEKVVSNLKTYLLEIEEQSKSLNSINIKEDLNIDGEEDIVPVIEVGDEEEIPFH